MPDFLKSARVPPGEQLSIRLHAEKTMPSSSFSLKTVKVIHTLAWAFFAGCIFAFPIVAWHGDFHLAAVLIAFVLIEVGILASNGMRCPLTAVAARFTDDRRDNFDIYLPLWLARHNKLIFGWLFVAGLAFTLARWAGLWLL